VGAAQRVQDGPVVAVLDGVVGPVVAAPPLDAQQPAAVVEVPAVELAARLGTGLQDLALQQCPGGRAHGRGHPQGLVLAGGQPGEVGGLVTPAAEPAYYARKIGRKTLDDPLSASGTLVCKGRQFHALIAFFHAGTVNEWRTANTVALRLLGRGDVFYAYV